MPRVLAVIPARFGSVRLPGKPLLLLDGEPLIAHVVRAARSARTVHRVLVATDHPAIMQAARAVGADAVMTASELPSGTDRVAAAVHAIQTRVEPDDLVVNVQERHPQSPPRTNNLHDALSSQLLTHARASCALPSPLSSHSPRTRLHAHQPSFALGSVDSLHSSLISSSSFRL